MVIQSLELSLGTAQCLDYTVGKCGEELVCKRRVAGKESITILVFHFEKERVLLSSAGAAALATIDQGNLAEDARWPQPRQELSTAMRSKAHVNRALHHHEAGVWGSTLR